MDVATTGQEVEQDQPAVEQSAFDVDMEQDSGN